MELQAGTRCQCLPVWVCRRVEILIRDEVVEVGQQGEAILIICTLFLQVFDGSRVVKFRKVVMAAELSNSAK